MTKDKKHLKESPELAQFNYELAGEKEKNNNCEREKYQQVQKSNNRNSWFELIGQLILILRDHLEFETAFELPEEIGYVMIGIAIVRCCLTLLKRFKY